MLLRPSRTRVEERGMGMGATGGAFRPVAGDALVPLGGARGVGEGLAGMGALEVRLAAKASEVRAAQKLRYRVFFEEGRAIAPAIAKLDKARHLPIRPSLRPFDRGRCLRQRGRWSARGRRGVSPVASGSRRRPFWVLQRGGIRGWRVDRPPSEQALSGTRPLLRRRRLSRPARSRVALAGHLGLRA